MKIPPELAEKLRTELIQTEEVMEMMYLDRKNPPPTLAEIAKVEREEGRSEGIKQTALKMLKEGISLDVVMKVTGLSKQELNQLQS